jgi:predicted anti-sigma-YlaC factor YlaD
MRVTRDVIQDLLPLYLAGEVSGDTRALVEEYLDTDPDFANEVRELEETGFLGDVPVPLTKEDQMEAYKEARRLMVLRTAVLAVAIATIVACALSTGLVAVMWFGALRAAS